MKFKTKLVTGFGVMIFLIILLTLMMIFTVNQLNQTTHEIVKDRYEYVKITTDLRNELSNINRSLSNMIITDDLNETEKNIQNVHKYRIETVESMNNLGKMVMLKDLKLQYQTLQMLNESFEVIENKVITLVSEGKKEEARKVMLEEAGENRTKLFSAIDGLIASQENLMEHSLNNASKTYHNTVQNGLIIMAISIMIVLAVTFWVINSTTKSLKKIITVFSTIDPNKPKHLPRLDISAKDEIGEISLAFNRIATSLEEHTKEEEHLKEKMVEENWLDNKITEVTLMYQGVSDIKVLASLIINKLTPLIDATYGVFYFREKDMDMDQLTRLAAYATSNENAKNVIQTGEGLVGQCVLECKKLLITQIPEGYIKISSGLGEAKPANLMLMPIELEGEAIGVLEFASFKPFLSHHQRLIERILRSLGISINRILNFMEVQRLLEESQTLTEELQSQSEELQLQQEEMKSINEKVEEQYKTSELKTKELEKIKEELEEKAHQLTQSNKYKSQFLANMSHELRTPLNSLLILAQILAENGDGNLSKKQVEYARIITSSGNDLLNLINDILDLAKIESGKTNLTMEEVSFLEISQFVRQQFNPVANKTGLGFELVFSSDLPDSIKTDKHRLQQILKNLLSNAFKFTKHGRIELIVKQSDKYLLSENHTPALAISVKDTGVGIPKEKQEIIFEAFQQADGTTSREYGGTGLGLSICRELATLLGGLMEVESIVGRGSAFTLYIPLTIQKDVSYSEVAAGIDIQDNRKIEENYLIDHQLEEPETELLENKRILIIDDDMRNIFALTTVLETHNIQVEFAENGEEGIKLLEDKKQHFDLILMDIMMPVMDGYETMNQIRNHPNQKMSRIPIIALTAKAMKSDKEKCIEAGASDYISKPINIEKLFSLMQLWLNR